MTKPLNKFIVLNINDAEDCLSAQQMENAREILKELNEYRRDKGKDPEPQYYVVNAQEPYAERVRRLIDIDMLKMSNKDKTYETIQSYIDKLHLNGKDVKLECDANAIVGLGYHPHSASRLGEEKIGDRIEIRVTGTLLYNE